MTERDLLILAAKDILVRQNSWLLLKEEIWTKEIWEASVNNLADILFLSDDKEKFIAAYR